MKSSLKIFVATALLSCCSAACDGEGSVDLQDVDKILFAAYSHAEENSTGVVVAEGRENLHCLDFVLCWDRFGGRLMQAICEKPTARAGDLSKWSCGGHVNYEWLMSVNLIKLECTENSDQCITPGKCNLRYVPQLTLVGLAIVLAIIVLATLLLVGLCCGISRCCCPSGDRKSYR